MTIQTTAALFTTMKPMKTPKQLELFAATGDAGVVHALGLLGWRDPLWTTRFEIPLLDGTRLPMTLATIRQLHAIARAPDPATPEIQRLGQPHTCPILDPKPSQ
jgi:hypothetical protein